METKKGNEIGREIGSNNFFPQNIQAKSAAGSNFICYISNVPKNLEPVEVDEIEEKNTEKSEKVKKQNQKEEKYHRQVFIQSAEYQQDNQQETDTTKRKPSEDSKSADDESSLAEELKFVDNSINFLFPIDSMSMELSIDEKNIKTLSSESENVILKQLLIDQPVGPKERGKSTYSYLHKFTPVTVSAYKNSVAILLKSENDSRVNMADFINYKKIFNDIRQKLKTFKTTFQEYFLSGVQNPILTHFSEGLIKYKENEEKDEEDAVYASCYTPLSEFQEKLSDLIGQNFRDKEKFYHDLQKNKITVKGELNFLKFYQLLYNYNYICNTKVIILGDFVKNWFKIFNDRIKGNWKTIYNKTMCFEFLNVMLPIQDIKIGENHITLLNIDGEVYTIGDGSKGALGIPARKFSCAPCRVIFPYPNVVIQKIAAGAKHNLALDKDKNLFAWGSGTCGCLGIGNEEDKFEPVTINFKGEVVFVTEIGAGDYYSACLSSEGAYYAWGNNQFGRLGISSDANTLYPQKFTENLGGPIVKLYCGYFTNLLLTSRDVLYGLGNHNLSEIEFYNNNNESDGRAHPVLIPSQNGNYLFRFFFPSRGKETKDKATFLEFFAGQKFFGAFVYHSVPNKNMAHTSLYTGGSFYDIKKIKLYPKEYSNFDFKPKLSYNFSEIQNGFYLEGMMDRTKEKATLGKNVIKKIMCSENNTAVMTSNGEVFVFGSFIYHLAPQQLENSFIPRQPNNIKVAHMALGANHILMITIFKEVYSAGRNMEGQLGIGYTNNFIDISSCKPIDIFSSSGAYKCYAAENYSVVITSGVCMQAWVFGDVSFLQSRSQNNKELLPKKVNWGEIEKVACGSNHMLLLRKEPNNFYTILSIGNGMYGKLGIDDPNGENKYEPVRVALPYYEIKTVEQVKMRCGKYTSGVIMRNSEDKKSKFYLWGLCSQNLFMNIKEVLKDHNYGTYTPLDNTIPVISPALITTYHVTNFDIGEGVFYFINNKSELEKVGDFPLGKKNKKENNVAEHYRKISVGLNHAAALSVSGKLYTWGSSIMNKLGYGEITEDEHIIDDLNDNQDKFMVNAPKNVVKFSEMFEEQSKKNEHNEDLKRIMEADKETIEGDEDEETPDFIETQNEIEDEEEKEYNPQEGTAQNVFSKAKEAVQYSTPKYDECEKKLKIKEKTLQEQMKEILKDYKFLTKNTEEAKSIYTSIQNLFFFKFGDAPINASFKPHNQNWKKFPPKLMTYKRNICAMLSLIHTHPCYLLNIYRNQLMPPRDLYRIIKSIYSLNREDKLSKLILIKLTIEIFKIDLAEKNIKDLKDFRIRVSDGGELSLFGKLCKLIFKLDTEFMKQQRIAAMYIIGNVFSSMKNWRECDEELQIKYHPDNRDEDGRDAPKLNNYKRNTRVEQIIKQLDYFANDLLKKPSLDKNNLFQVSNLIAGGGDSDYLFMLPEISFTLVQELKTYILKNINGDVEAVMEWMAKEFAQILFCRMIKILEEPYARLTGDASLLLDYPLYRSFMEASKDNFFSLAYTFRYCLDYLPISDQNIQQDDELKKQIENVFHQTISSFIISLKNLLMNRRYDGTPLGDIESKTPTPTPDNKTANGESISANESTMDQTADTEAIKSKTNSGFDDLLSNSIKMDFDFKFLREFFNNSLEDSLYVINISLSSLRKLFKVISNCRDKIRVLNEKFDILEQILKYNNFIDNLTTICEGITDKNDKYVQFKLKIKSLCLKNPSSITRCRYCGTLLLNEHIQGKESLFFNQFDFINMASGKGKLIEILKKVDNIDLKQETFTSFLKSQMEKKKEDEKFKESIYQLFTLIAIESKDNLCIGEETIQDKDKFIEEMCDPNINLVNVKLKEYAVYIKQCYEDMKEKRKYYFILEKILEEIKSLPEKYLTIDPSGKVKSKKLHFLNDIYKKVGKSILLGYGNKEITVVDKNLSAYCILQKLMRHNNALPKSETIYKNLPEAMKEKMEIIREFNFRDLLTNKVIVGIEKYKSTILQAPDSYWLVLNKTKTFEFNCTLLRKNISDANSKTSAEAKKVMSFLIDSEHLRQLIRASTNKQNDKYSKETPITVSGFITVAPSLFLMVLKNLFNVGFYTKE